MSSPAFSSIFSVEHLVRGLSIGSPRVNLVRGSIMLPRLTKWLRNSRKIRRCLYGLACFFSLVLLFYAEEDWRGKHAWEQYKREWEAKGERFDFASFVPPTVPDDQNFALTPIVASAYNAFLDQHGNRIEPSNTNVVDRLGFRMDSPQYLKPWPTNDFEGNWQCGIKVDLKVFQSYYRAPVNAKRLVGVSYTGRFGRRDFYEPLKATNDFPTAPQPQSPAADVLLALSKYDAAIEELRQASRLPYARFPHNYDARPISAKVLFPASSSLMQCAKVLRLRAVAELGIGLNDKAMDDIKLMLYLANSLRDEPLLLSQGYCIGIINLALQPLWEGLCDHKWSDAQLAVIEQQVAQIDFLSRYQLAVRGERVLAIDAIDQTEGGRGFPEIYAAFFPAPDESTSGTRWDRGIEATKLFLIPKGWFFQNDLAVAQIFQQWLLTDAEGGGRMLPLEITKRAERAFFDNTDLRTPYNVFTSVTAPFSMQRFAFAQSFLDMARVVCGLEHYHLAHGEYPATLDPLSPQFIERIPHDLINEQPLHYRRMDDGQFLLYSVGWNGSDDGGIAVRKDSWNYATLDIQKGDWVWPCLPVYAPPPSQP
jgi:hypothetical protein